MKNETNRQLAAIVFTDIVGFTKLTAINQSKASNLLKEQRKILRPIVDSYSGKWIKEMGDGLLLTFDTITDAVNCCIELQETSKKINDLTLRIGIHLGEILVEENDVIGDDVNIAARIEPFSAPGGIAISNKVHDAIVRESEFETKYLGKPKLKGVGQNVEVYCITSHGLPKTVVSEVSAKLEPEGFQWNLLSATGAVLSIIGALFWINVTFIGIGVANTSDVPSIAILPFDNKGTPDDDFFAYGISSDLISYVTSAGLIRVASLSDIEKLDYQELENSALAKKLFVRYVAHGTLWKRDSVFQLSMEIFDTELSKVAYTKRWQTNWKNLSTIKDDLSENILGALEVEVREKSDHNPIASNPEAYEYFLRASHKYNKRQNTDDVNLARGMLIKAIELDENLLKAKALLGNTYLGTGDFNKALEIFNNVLEQAENLLNKDVAAHMLNTLGIVHYYRGQNDEALDYWERSIVIYEEIGNIVEVGSVTGNIGNAYGNQDKIELAMDQYKKALAIDKEMDDIKGIAHHTGNIAIIYLYKGEVDSALIFLERAIAIKEEIGDKSSLTYSIGNLGVLYHDEKGDYEKALFYHDRALAISDELGDKKQISSNLANIGSVYLDMGDFDKALDYFDRALSISEKIGNKGQMIFIFCQKGFLYSFDSADLELSAKYLEQAQVIVDEIGTLKDLKIFIQVYLFNTYKQLGKSYDLQKVVDALENIDNKNFQLNYGLYKLLDDRSFLKDAYHQVQQLGKPMEDKQKEEFFNFPMQRLIIDQYKMTL